MFWIFFLPLFGLVMLICIPIWIWMEIKRAGRTERGRDRPNRGERNLPARFPSSWKCSCGREGNTGRFCSECGKHKLASSPWACPCGQTGNAGKFCPSCGRERS